MPLSVDFLAGLYNRHSCYADRLTTEELDSIHVSTKVEAALKKWIRAKKDVVLTGNPGDGKTYLLRRLGDEIDRVGGDRVLDATAERDYSAIIRRWKRARSKGQPFLLAINQGPLDRLLRSSARRDAILLEVERQLSEALYYGTNPPKPPQGVVVVDLNLRSVLGREIVETALNNLLKEDNFSDCGAYFADETTDIHRNRHALLHPQVRDRLARLLSAAGYTSRHITMRDLQGFLSYLVFGGADREGLAQRESGLEYRYFNLCFEGQGELFEAVREVFDPVRATVPNIDEDLWENTGVHEAWIFSRLPLTPDHYPDAWEQFTALKRQYFFEHENGGQLLESVSEAERSFQNLVTPGADSGKKYLGRVLQAINRFYCSDLPDDERHLRLWNSQQYDTHLPTVLVSCYRVDREKFSLDTPRVAPWLEELDYRPDHIMLRYTGNRDSFGLRIDRSLWRALMLAGRSIPLALRSSQHSQRLKAFMTKLHRVEVSPQPVQSAILLSIASGRRQHIAVDLTNARYIDQ